MKVKYLLTTLNASMTLEVGLLIIIINCLVEVLSSLKKKKKWFRARENKDGSVSVLRIAIYITVVDGMYGRPR